MLLTSAQASDGSAGLVWLGGWVGAGITMGPRSRSPGSLQGSQVKSPAKKKVLYLSIDPKSEQGDFVEGWLAEPTFREGLTQGASAGIVVPPAQGPTL